MEARQTFAVAAAITLALLPAACKINKDANCLNPKAGCFKKDTEQPTIVDTNPISTATMANPTPQNSLSVFTLTFSEPMKNADQKSNYPSPTGSGSNGMTIASVEKIDEKNSRVKLSGSPGAGTVALDLSALTDLSGNTLTNPVISFQINGITSNHDFVSASGYTTVILDWKNNSIYPVNYQVKSGADCSGAVLAGTNVDSLGTPINPQTQVLTTLTLGNFTNGVISTIRVCQTTVPGGTLLELTINIGRDDSAPATTPSPATTTVLATSTVLPFPANITLACTNNYDQISYTINNTATPAFPPPVGNLFVGSGFTLPVPTALGERDRTVRYRCLDKAGNAEIEKTSYYRAELQWADSGGKSENWDWAYWK